MKSVQPLAVSFQPSPAEAERTSTFQLDGHRPPLSLEPGGWLVASVPVSGAPADPAVPAGSDLWSGQGHGRAVPAGRAAVGEKS